MTLRDELTGAFRSNPKLKKPGVKIEFTQENALEMARCATDPIHFIETYVKIHHVDRGIIPFKMYDYQKRFIRLMHNNRFVSARMARQMGKSVCVAAYFCWYIIFNEAKTCAITANKAATAQEIIARVQTAYENLPLWLQQGVVSWNVMSFSLENKSRVIAAATSSSAIRGMSISFLFMDEVAFIPKNQWERFYNSVYSTISSGKNTKIAMVSTPFGMNHFYQMHTKAIRKQSEFKAIDVTWRQHPERDEEWKRVTIANTSARSFSQEHEVQFIGSALTLIDAGILSSMQSIEPVELGHDGNLVIFERAQEGRTYAISADVSQGTGNDFSAFSVVDVTGWPWKQVARYSNNSIDPETFAGVINRTGKYYNHAWVLVETNDQGVMTAKELWRTYEYENMLFSKSEDPSGNSISKSVLGVQTTKKTKKIGCIRLKQVVEAGQIQLNDEATIQELVVFVKNPNRKEEVYSAEDGFHDDMVMGLVNLCYYAQTNKWESLGMTKASESIKASRDAIVDSLKIYEPVVATPEVEKKRVRPKEAFQVTTKGYLSELEVDELKDFLR